MKHCVSCVWSKSEGVEVAQREFRMVLVCQHEECSNPVTGNHMLCEHVRPNEAFCGLKAKYFKQKEAVQVEDKVVQLIQTT